MTATRPDHRKTQTTTRKRLNMVEVLRNWGAKMKVTLNIGHVLRRREEMAGTIPMEQLTFPRHHDGRST